MNKKVDLKAIANMPANSEQMHKCVFDAMSMCRYFDGVPKQKYPNVLSCLQAKVRTFKKGEVILRFHCQSSYAGIVVTGTVQQNIYDDCGKPITYSQLTTGGSFGAELACSPSAKSLTEISCTTDCSVLFCNFSNVLAPEQKPCQYRQLVASNLLRDFATQVMQLNLRLRIMSQKHIRSKVKIYLQNEKINENDEVMLPFNRVEWAKYLYTDRTALAKEMTKLQKEGILISDKRRIKILDKSFLIDP